MAHNVGIMLKRELPILYGVIVRSISTLLRSVFAFITRFIHKSYSLYAFITTFIHMTYSMYAYITKFTHKPYSEYSSVVRFIGKHLGLFYVDF